MNETEISFIGSPAKHGSYYIFTIPNKLIKKGIIDPDATFKVLLKPINEIKNKEKANKSRQKL